MGKDDVKNANAGVAVVKIDDATRAKVQDIIKNRALLAAGLGLVPVPVLNFASATVIQIAMVQSIRPKFEF